LRARFAPGHHDAGDDEREDEHQQAAAEAGDDAQRLGRQFADLGLHALDQCRQVLVRLRPERMHFLADDRPGSHLVGRRRHLERVVAHAVDHVMHRVAELAAQHDRRRDDDGDGEQHDQRRREPLLAADPGGEHLVQRIDRDRQDQRPQHHRHEWREDLVAQHTNASTRPARMKTSSRRRDRRSSSS
jgi:hypothetical protein